MTFYMCRMVMDQGCAQSFETRSPEEAAERFGQWCFDNWAWESVTSDYPMRVEVDGVGEFEVELECVPEFSAHRLVRCSCTITEFERQENRACAVHFPRRPIDDPIEDVALEEVSP